MTHGGDNNLVGKPKRRDHLEDINVLENNNNNVGLNRSVGVWNAFNWLRTGSISEQGNETKASNVWTNCVTISLNKALSDQYYCVI
jgi:hypothetical protein